MASPLARHWTLEEGLAFLNHGSFGACPRPVLEYQQQLRDEIERQPVKFFVRRLPGLLDAARDALAEFVGGDPAGLAAIPNATSGVNAVLRSLDLAAGDELLVTDHEYNASANALQYAADRAGAKVVVVPVPFPCSSSQEFVDRLIAALTPRTRLVLVDHITSPTGMILPLEALIPRLTERGIDTLVDGAHAPGMLPLALDELGSAYYTGNCHKWLCAPKGAAFLYVREDRREGVRPLTISHGANSPRPGRSRFHDEFDWMGTDDPTAFLSVPTSLEFLSSLLPGGWAAIREHNRTLALEGRELLTEVLSVSPPCPDEMIGSLVSLPLSDGSSAPPESPLYTDPLQDRLLFEHRIEVPIVPWPKPPRRLIRISAQLYNDIEDYRRLAGALRTELGQGDDGRMGVGKKR